MSLLTTASLVVTPNAGDEGTLFSIIPDTGLGDLSVTRATTATRVNSAGLVELVPYNLFTYSSSFSNAAWAKINTTVTGSQSGYDGTNNAFLITDNSTNGVHLIGQTPIVSGQHTVSIYAKANTLNWLWLRGVQSSANVRAWFNLSTGTVGTVETNGTANIVNVGNGWYRCELTIANHESGFEFYVGVTNANGATSYVGSGQSLYIQDAQLVEGSVAKDYQKTETRLNIPRLDYSIGTCPSLLVEPQRTNLFKYSANLADSNWSTYAASGTITRTANYAAAPDGTTTATRIQNSGGDPIQWTYQNIALASNGIISMYVKRTGATNQTFRFFSNNGATFSSNFTATDTWQRFEFAVGSNGSALPFGITTDSSGTAADILVWGAQCEIGSYATSYIPTTSASVTRNADVISKTGISSLIGQTEGTLFWDVDFEVVANNDAIFIKENATFDTFVFMQKESSGVIACGYYGSGALQARIESSPVTVGRYKIAFAYKNNDFVMYLNGTQVGTDTSGTVSGLMDYFDLHWTESGCNNAYASALWKTRLTNTQLAALTTI